MRHELLLILLLRLHLRLCRVPAQTHLPLRLRRHRRGLLRHDALALDGGGDEGVRTRTIIERYEGIGRPHRRRLSPLVGRLLLLPLLRRRLLLRYGRKGVERVRWRGGLRHYHKSKYRARDYVLLAF